MKCNNHGIYTLVLLFPITIYVFVGTSLLFILYSLEKISETLNQYSIFPYIKSIHATKWHKKHPLITYLFPVVLQ